MGIERRLQPRIRTSLAATVVNRNGETIPAEVIDLSISGFAIAVEPQMVGHIEVIDAKSGSTYFPVEISLTITLADSGGDLTLGARQVYKRRLSQNSFQFGFLITAFTGDSERLLREYIQRQRG